jgi:S-formylglutathione hydrolase FrmB
LPAGYATHPKSRYPVLWMLHGAGGGADSWVDSPTNITRIAAGLPAIVVMPDGGVYGMYMDWWNGGARSNPAWATYHLQVLRSAIEQRFRIRAGRRWHAIAGISMGGQGALRYAAMLPGYFGSVAGFSAALPDTQSLDAQVGLGVLAAIDGGSGATYDAIFGPATAAYAAGNSPQAVVANYGHTRIFLSSGNGINCPQDPIDPATIAIDMAVEADVHRQEGPFAAAARAAGATVTARTTCGVHTFGVWNRAFAAARVWGFFRPVPNRPAYWQYRTVAMAGQMWGLRFRFAAPPSTVAEFRFADRTLYGAGTGYVVISGGPGCNLSLTLPFVHQLPAACQQS